VAEKVCSPSFCGYFPRRRRIDELTRLYAEYQSITTKSDRLEYLSKSLASLQLELDLLRAKYPHPRRTIDELEEHAQEQVEAIIALTERKEQRAAELARKRKEVEEAQKRD
jgi:chromosome segregation ATPase